MLEAITLPSLAAERRLSKLKPDRTVTNTTHGRTENSQKCPLVVSVSAVCRSHVVFMFDRQKHLSIFLFFLEIVFLCPMIRNCINRTNHSYVSWEETSFGKFLPSRLLHWNEHIWQEYLAGATGNAIFEHRRVLQTIDMQILHSTLNRRR